MTEISNSEVAGAHSQLMVNLRLTDYDWRLWLRPEPDRTNTEHTHHHTRHHQTPPPSLLPPPSSLLVILRLPALTAQIGLHRNK